MQRELSVRGDGVIKSSWLTFLNQFPDGRCRRIAVQSAVPAEAAQACSLSIATEGLSSLGCRRRYSGGTAILLLAACASFPLHAQLRGVSHGSPLLFATGKAATNPLVLTAYSMDGTNSGTARLGRNVTILASAAGYTNPAFTWTLTGAGTLSSTGIYTAPAAMPQGSTATVTATMISSPAITASYTMTLTYAVPTIRWATPTLLIAGRTNAVTVVGYDFTPATTILAGGVAVPSSFQAPNTVVAQVAVPSGATQPVSLVASNPAPGGGLSAPVAIATSLPKLTLTEYSVDGTNSGTARLGRNVTLVPSLPGSVNPAYTWSLQGPGTLSNAGVYSAPAVMPSSPIIKITATLVSNTAVTSTSQLTLIYAVPTVRWLTPSQLISGKTNAVSITGYDFTPATTILVGGQAVSSVYQSPGIIVAQIPVGPVALSSVPVVAQNPLPGGGTSAASVATILPLTVQISSYSQKGLSPTTVTLGQSVQFLASVLGSGNPSLPWNILWSVQGGGSISSSGLYQAPAAMPANVNVTITATLSNDVAITATSGLSLLHPSPVINDSAPLQVASGRTTLVTFLGEGFEPTTQLLLNGVPMASTYISANSIAASVNVAANSTSALAIRAQNAAPGGGLSAAFNLPIGSAALVTATVGSQPGLAVPGDFVGFSHEWGDAQGYLGWSTVGANAIYRQLLTNLSNPGWPFLVRIGGGSTDSSVEPVATTVSAFSELATALPVKFSLGVNLGANNLQLAKDQTAFFVSHMPAGSIRSIEIGNEPDMYSSNGFRASTYTAASYASDLNTWASGVLPLLPSATRLMAPSFASVWYMQQNLPLVEQQQSASLALVSQHFYALTQTTSSTIASDALLQPSVSTSHVPALAAAAVIAHGYKQSFRIGELNSIDNGGLAGVSNNFTAALWSIDTMFEYANAGIDGVNWHGTSNCNYCAFSFGVQTLAGKRLYTLQQVNPLYYGLLFFHQATANGAKLLPVALTSTPNIKVWATVDLAGVTHVAILNKDEAFSGTVAINLPGHAQASVSRLVAPGYQSVAGISFGGQTFDGSMDGTLVGSPIVEAANPSNGVYAITVQPVSAVLLTVPAS